MLKINYLGGKLGKIKKGSQTCDPSIRGPERIQTPYLYHVPDNKRYDLGDFYEPVTYKGEWRCDLYPRSSADGNIVIIDSTHEGLGSQMYLIDISQLIK